MADGVAACNSSTVQEESAVQCSAVQCSFSAFAWQSRGRLAYEGHCVRARTKGGGKGKGRGMAR